MNGKPSANFPVLIACLFLELTHFKGWLENKGCFILSVKKLKYRERRIFYQNLFSTLSVKFKVEKPL